MNELKIPDAAKCDPNAKEILRMWLAGGGQHICLKIEPSEDPAGWGLILADLAQLPVAGRVEIHKTNLERDRQADLVAQSNTTAQKGRVT